MNGHYVFFFLISVFFILCTYILSYFKNFNSMFREQRKNFEQQWRLIQVLLQQQMLQQQHMLNLIKQQQRQPEKLEEKQTKKIEQQPPRRTTSAGRKERSYTVSGVSKEDGEEVEEAEVVAVETNQTRRDSHPRKSITELCRYYLPPPPPELSSQITSEQEQSRVMSRIRPLLGKAMRIDLRNLRCRDRGGKYIRLRENLR
nr:uncharacterized protein LOC117221939 [Megalopta genalis]